MDHDAIQSLLQAVAKRAREAGVFAAVDVDGAALLCRPAETDVDGEYAVTCDPQDAGPFVVLRSPDRWLSESIETDLMHTGDDLGELIEDELSDLGESYRPEVQHYRDDQMRYTFRSPIPINGSEPAESASRLLLAYEAAFRNLGNMRPSKDD